MAKRNARAETVKGNPDPDLLKLPPATRSQRLLPLQLVNDKDFEFICVDIAEREPEIQQADLKRVDGVAQFGVDVEAFSADHRPTLVISSKRYQAIAPGDIARWNNDFLKFWDSHWRERGVQRFVLSVTVELNDDTLNERIAAEARRFRDLGIAYEVWGLKQLTSRLQNLRPTINRYFHPAWIEVICGPEFSISLSSGASSTIGAAADQISRGLAGTAEAIARRFGENAKRELENALMLLQQGSANPLRDVIRRLRDEAVTFSFLPSDVKARILRADAVLALRTGDAARARSLIDDSILFEPLPDRALMAIVRKFEDGPHVALRLLEAPGTSQEASVKAGLFLELGDAVAAEATIQNWPNTSPEDDHFEPLRLGALAKALRRLDEEAIELIERADNDAPRNFAVAWARAVISYNSALSPALPAFFGSFPNPMPSGLVRDDENARDRLNEAERIFERLARTVDVPDYAEDLKVWRLACLIADPDRARDAECLAQEMLSVGAPHPGAVVWAAAARIPFNHDEIAKKLNFNIDSGNGTVSDAVAIAYLAITRNNSKRALTALNRARQRFNDADSVALIDHWTDQVSNRMTAPTEKGAKPGSLTQALNQLRRHDDARGVIAFLDAGQVEPDGLLVAFEALMARRRWSEVRERQAQLLSLGTAAAATMSIVAAFNLGQWPETLALIEEHRTWFHGGRLSRDLRELEAKAQMASGRPDLAVKQLEALRKEAEDPAHSSIELARTLLQIGDLPRAADAVRGIRFQGDVRLQDRLQIAWELRQHFPGIAKNLLEHVNWAALQDRLVPTSLSLATELSLHQAQKVLGPRLASAPGVTVFDSVEEVIAWVQEHGRRQDEASQLSREKWLELALPIQAAFNGRETQLLDVFWGPFESPPFVDRRGQVAGTPLLVRSGHRTQHEMDEAVGEERRPLVLDITAILLGEQLGLLDSLSFIADPILVPGELIECLRLMESELNQQFQPLLPALQFVLDRMGDGTIGEATASGLAELRLLAPDEKETGVVTVGEVLRALIDTAGLDAAIVEAAMHANEAITVPAKTELSPESEYRIRESDLLELTRAGLVPELLRHVGLLLPPEDAADLRRRVADHGAGRQRLERLTVLRQFIAERLQDGWQLLRATGQMAKAEQIAGPATKGLYAVLRAADAMQADFWIEDRLLSRQGKLGSNSVIDVTDVMSRLQAAGSLSASRRSEMLRSLSRAGYSFLLPDAHPIVEALVAAPLRGVALVETDRLAEFRRAFALQLANARYASELPGGIESPNQELRVISRLLALPTDVLVLLWQRTGLAEGRFAAASNWVWTNLRVEQVDYLPRENRSPDSKRELAFLPYLSLITSFLRMGHGHNKRSLGLRARYLEWAINSIVDPFAEVEPLLTEWIRDRVAAYLSEFLNASQQDDPLPFDVLRALIRQLIDCFPDRWAKAILARDSMRNAFPTTLIETIGVGPNIAFAAADFFAGVEGVVASKQSTAQLRSGKGSATFELLGSFDGSEPLRFKVSTSSETAWVADDTLNMLLTDRQARLDTILRRGDWFDLGGQELARVAVEIADLPGYRHRIDRISEIQNETMIWRLEKLAAQIRDEKRSDRDLLAPPSPNILLQYLRANTDSTATVEPGAWTEACFNGLSAEFGADVAAQRMAGIPMRLSRRVLGDIAAEVHERNPTGSLTPMHAATLAAAFSTVGGDLRRQHVVILADTLSEFGPMFVTFLRWTAAAANKDSQWGAVAEPLRSMLLWCHADAVCRVMIESGVDGEETIGIFKRNATESIERTCARLRDRDRLVPEPADVDPHVLAAAAASYAYGRADIQASPISPEEFDCLRGIYCFQTDERWIPHLEILMTVKKRERDVCWLNVDPFDGPISTEILGIPAPFAFRDAERMASVILDNIEAEGTTEGEGLWPFLWLIAPRLLSNVTQKRIVELAQPSRLSSILSQEPHLMHRAFSYRAAVMAHAESRPAFDALLEEAIAEVGRQLGPRARVGADSSQHDCPTEIFVGLAEAAWVYAVESGSSFEQAVAITARQIGKIADHWPHSIEACLATLDGLARQVRTDVAGPVWDEIHRVRLI